MMLTMFAIVDTQAQKLSLLNVNGADNIVKSVATTDSTLTYVDSISLKTNEAGIIEVAVIGYAKDTAYAVTGVKKVRFNKRRGTLTLGTVADEQAVVADAALGTSTFDIVAARDKILVRVKGKAATNITWYSILKRKSVTYN